jgi:hypothetical protein
MSNASRFFRFLRGLSVVPALFVCLASANGACSGGVASAPAGDPTPASTSGGPPAGGTPVGGNQGTAAEAVPGDTATRFELAHTFCGAASASCAGDAAVQIVDFATATLETHRCVELKDDGGTESIPAAPPGTSPRFGSQRGDAITTRALTPAQMATLRTALGNVRFAPARLSELDGAMTVLSVDAPSGALSLTPIARCGAEDYEQIVGGLPSLQETLDAL